MGRLIVVASGKGGVGKSTITSSMAVIFAGKGLRTLLVDADVGLRSLDLMMGVQDRVLYELADCMALRCTLEEATITHDRFPQLHLMMAGQEAKPKDFDQKSLRRITATLKERYDIVLVDAPAGIGRGVKNFFPHADQFILAATPDDVCLRDSEKMARLILEATGERAWLILNRFDARLMRRGMLHRPEDISLSLDLPLLGVIPQSDSVYRAMLERKTIPEGADAPPARALERICDRFLGIPVAEGWLRRLFRKEKRS